MGKKSTTSWERREKGTGEMHLLTTEGETFGQISAQREGLKDKGSRGGKGTASKKFLAGRKG